MKETNLRILNFSHAVQPKIYLTFRYSHKLFSHYNYHNCRNLNKKIHQCFKVWTQGLWENFLLLQATIFLVSIVGLNVSVVRKFLLNYKSDSVQCLKNNHISLYIILLPFIHNWTVIISDAYIKLKGNVTQCKSDKQQTNKLTTNRNLCFVFICFS